MKYIVNRTTKEHKVLHRHTEYATCDWSIVQADSDGWIPHTGNECPLPDDVRCEYKMRDGDLSSAKASNLRWSHRGINCDADIVAYRPILEPEKVQEPEPKAEQLLDRLKAAHKVAQTIPDLEAELREVLAGMGYDLVARSPFANQCCCNPAQCWEPCGVLGKSEAHVAVSPEPDMSDWRNWREGDVLECVNGDGHISLASGNLVTVRQVQFTNGTIMFCHPDGFEGVALTRRFRFHSRPSKGEK